MSNVALLVAVAWAASAAPLLTALRAPHAFPVIATRVSFQQAHHDYPAADIFCPRGSKFVAPIAGVVDFISDRDLWDPKTNRPEHRGGIAVAIIGADGWRYYGSHLDSVAPDIRVGHRVVSGQVLGLTGSSGNARGTSPHLHFGISRPSTPGDWKTRRGEIAPYDYLKLWQAADGIVRDDVKRNVEERPAPKVKQVTTRRRDE